MPEPVSVLVLGGSGVFGERACRRLARTPGLRVLLAGRDERKAETAAAAIARDVPSADIQGIGLPADRLEAFLAQSRPSVVLLVAGSGDGPWIPAIPAVLVARKLALGQLPQRGAMACQGLFTLEEFFQEVADLNISARTFKASITDHDLGDDRPSPRLIMPDIP